MNIYRSFRDRVSVWAPCAISLVLSLGCGKSIPESVSTDRNGVAEAGPLAPTGHESMRAILGQIAERTAREHPYIGSSQADQLKQILNEGAFQLSPQILWVTTFQLAQADLKLGQERDAIKRFQQCRDFLPQAIEDPEKQRQAQVALMLELGVAYMRLGETQNCCLRNHPDSCILPIEGKGVHTNQEGSRQAITCFTQVLENTEPEDPRHLKARWLLNLAWMTLGEHPGSVPEEHLIPPEAFKSTTPLKRFVNIAQSLKLDTFSMCGGAIIDDFDNDDHLDLIVSSWDPRDQIKWFRNRGDGTFEDHTDESGLVGFCGGLNMVQADYDNDGDTDFFILRGAWLAGWGGHPNSLMRNNGDGTFTDVTLDVGMDRHFPTQTAAWADYDNDGDLDLFVGNESAGGIDAPCQLYRNDDDGMFRDVAAAAGVTNDRFTKAVVWGDFDADRYPDLFVSNQGGTNRLYKNNRDGTFRDVAATAGVEGPQMSFPAWFWDFDNDGNLDLYVSVYAASTADLATFHLGGQSSAERSALYRGDGKGGFVNVTDQCGLDRPDASMGANFGDLDNDGYLDFYLGTGYPSYESLMPSVMYLNERGERFVDVTTAGGFGHLQKGHAVAFADLDHDGDQDVFEQMGGAFPGDRFHDALYENPGLGNHWLTLRLVGTRSNRSAIGARICVEISENGKDRRIFRHVNSGGSFGANPLRQTIGLGAADQINKLEIYWPSSDSTQSFSRVPMDQHFLIEEGRDELEPMDLKPFKLGATP
jgi:hypothetical protein